MKCGTNSHHISASTRCVVWIKYKQYGNIKVKVKWSRYRPGVAQRVGRGIALLFHVRGTRRGWVVSSTPWPQFTPGKDPIPILQEAGWAPGPVWTGGKSRPHQDSIPDRPTRSQSLYRLSYPAHMAILVYGILSLFTHIAYKYCVLHTETRQKYFRKHKCNCCVGENGKHWETRGAV